MKLTKPYYKKILKFKKKYKINDFELITNYGLFSGDTNLFKTLKIYELILKTKNIKGDIIELGIHKGNTSLLIKKILDIFKIKKKFFLLDHFKGLIHYRYQDTKLSKSFKGKYVGKKRQIEDFIKFFKFKSLKILDKDATKLNSDFFKKNLFSFAYFDMDLYLPTLVALRAIDKSMSKGGYIVFDQGNKKLWAEKRAIKDFLKENKRYKKISINSYYQPDIILKKV
tara:strand:- start:429 stop:1106 length:678 start_codon:yes stop_codon:yes gene_type:complete